MNSTAQVGRWYTRLDTGETFLVTGYDDKSRTIETQAINGCLLYTSPSPRDCS